MNWHHAVLKTRGESPLKGREWTLKKKTYPRFVAALYAKKTLAKEVDGINAEDN